MSIEFDKTKIFHHIYAGLHYCPHDDPSEDRLTYLNADEVLPVISKMEDLLEEALGIIDWAAYVAEKSKHQSDCYEWMSKYQELIEEHGLELNASDFTKEDAESYKQYFKPL